jgi:MoCo/4Fe-4S cofactor protein with predicted Tat translocation signal
MPSVSQEVRDQRSEVSAQPSAEGRCCGDELAVRGSLFVVRGDDHQRTTNNEQQTTPARGKAYWRSLEDLADTPEFREFVFREFPAGATDMLQGDDRRSFLKIMGASLALAGLGVSGGGCRRWPEQTIAPYAHRPADHAPGTFNYFATCCEIGGVASGLLATSSDFRPIKIDGNPQHPINQGGSDALLQATVLGLYDPDRSQHVLHEGKASNWESFVAWAKSHFAGLQNARGSGLAVLSEATSSPSVLAMKQRLTKALPGAKWYEYEPLNNDSAVAGSTMAFGGAFRPHYAFDKAGVIVALDCDFLHCDPASIKNSREFAVGRRADDGREMNRLYAFEAGVSLTGANADHRVAMRSADVAIIAARIAEGVAPDAAAAVSELAKQPISSTTDPTRVGEIIAHAIADLKAHRGAGIVIAGPRQPAQVHLLAHVINEALDNLGTTIKLTPLPETQQHAHALGELTKSINENGVQTLVIIGGNPVYNAPADVRFTELIKALNTTIHLSEYVDETSALCTWHVNRAHFLECWGDGRAYDGTVSLCQPLIEPLFGGKSAVELLAAITADELTNGYDIVRRTFAEMTGGMLVESAWRTALHDGVVPNSTMPMEEGHPPVKVQDLSSHVAALTSQWAAPKGDELEAIFTQDFCLYDGRFANNGWLQEMPDPITRLTWDNAALMGVDAARSRGLKTGDMVKVRVGSAEVEAPVMLLPGHHRGSITLSLGYGRKMDGRICKDAGFDFYPLRTSNTMGFAEGATITQSSGSYVLATTQDHYALDSVAGRGTQERLPTLFREGSVEEYRKDPGFAAHRTHVVHRLSLFDEDMPFQGPEGAETARYAWAMSIDLNSCTGCNACVVACQAENNVPIVGKDQVKRNREMHWLRVDRYFKGGTEALPEGFMLAPVLCMHCENAPCEQVCPVAATVHDDDGLNVMVYNRCVGTRYCSNNCPYKVRRFNYFDYWRREPLREQPGTLLQVPDDYYIKSQAKADPLRQMQFNPDVTVRMRGIMEKCTYCVQRITKARIEAKNKWVEENPQDRPPGRVAPIADGTITPACAQACPAQAIVFGDLKDPGSRVSNLHKDKRSYQMLEELNTKPRTRYMAKLRNPAGGGEKDPHGHG